MQVDISIILVNYRAAGLVRECIKGLKMLGTKHTFETIVVDNSADFSLASLLAERYPDVVYIAMKKNVGFSSANNIGIRHARGKYVLILNYDITPLPHSLDLLYEYMETHPEVGIVGPRLLNPDNTTQDSFYRFHSLLTPLLRRSWFGKLRLGKQHIDHFLMHDVKIEGARDVDWILGACLFVRASAIQKVGLMDERFFLYFEDTDWCRRFWQEGYKVRYYPDSQMIHLHRRDSAQGGACAALFHPATRTHITSWVKYILKWKRHGRSHA